MEITLISRKRFIDNKIEIDHYWYDHHTQTMYHGRRGKMLFPFNTKESRMLPKIVEHIEKVMSNDYDLICEWVKENVENFDLTIEHDDGRNIVVSCSVAMFDHIAHSLWINEIHFDYDYEDFAKEAKKYVK